MIMSRRDPLLGRLTPVPEEESCAERPEIGSTAARLEQFTEDALEAVRLRTVPRACSSGAAPCPDQGRQGGRDPFAGDPGNRRHAGRPGTGRELARD